MNKVNFKCTDPDCAQYCAKIDDATYSYIEYREYFNEFVVCHAVIDLRDYDLDTIWHYCSGYYDSFEQMVESYGFRNVFQIIAECIFEQLGFEDMEFNSEQSTEGKAIKFVHDWMNKQ